MATRAESHERKFQLYTGKKYFESRDIEPDFDPKSKVSFRIPAGGELDIPILVTEDLYPGPFREVDPEDVKEHTLSAQAQRGASVKEGDGKRIYLRGQERKRRLGRFYPFQDHITTYNHGAQDLEINARFCEFYTEGPRLTGRALIESIGELGNPKHKDRPIILSGQQGEDWELIFDNGEDKPENAVGIYMKIDRSTMRYVPAQPVTDEPLSLPRDYKSSREYPIEKHTVPVPDTREKILWLAYTKAQLHLPAGVHAVLGKAVVTDVRKKELDHLEKEGDQTHKNSRHLKGWGKTNWEVIVEVFGPTDDKVSAHYLPVFFFEE